LKIRERRQGMTREEFMAMEREREPKRANVTIVSANLIRWLGELSALPGEVLDAGKAVLEKARKGGVGGFNRMLFNLFFHPGPTRNVLPWIKCAPPR
jgi:hypothetical protein